MFWVEEGIDGETMAMSAVVDALMEARLTDWTAWIHYGVLGLAGPWFISTSEAC